MTLDEWVALRRLILFFFSFSRLFFPGQALTVYTMEWGHDCTIH